MKNDISIVSVEVAFMSVSESAHDCARSLGTIDTITDSAGVADAINAIASAEAFVRNIEAVRKEYSAPLDARKKLLIAEERRLSEPIAHECARLRKLVSAYEAARQREREAEAERARAEAEAALTKADAAKTEKTTLKYEAIAAAALAAEIGARAAAPKNLARVLVIDSVDINRLPREYCMPNLNAIRDTLRAGVEINGVVSHYEQSVRIARA